MPPITTNVAPVFKKGEKYNAANYRPVLLMLRLHLPRAPYDLFFYGFQAL